MNINQKKLILVALVLAAFVFHVFFCEWGKCVYIKPIYKHSDELMLCADDILAGNNVLAVVLGLIIPAMFLAGAGFLYLGWQEEFSENSKENDLSD